MIDLGSSDCVEDTLSGFVFSDVSGESLTFAWAEMPSANVQVIHNSPSPIVDIYIDGDLAISNFEYRLQLQA